MDVIASSLKVARTAAIDQQSFVAPAKQMSEKLVPAVIPLGVGSQQPFHARDQVGIRRFNHEMEMVRHETEAVHLPPRLLAALPQRRKEPVSVSVVAKNLLAMIATAHHVVNGVRILYSQLPSHKTEWTDASIS